MAKSVLVNSRRSGVRVAPVLGFQTLLPPTISSLNYSQGQPAGGGMSIVITGTNFTGTTSVTFLGTVAAFVIDSDLQITATLPAHAAGSGNVQVTNPSGSATIAFEYWSPAQMSLTGWWEAPFGGSPWAGKASAGASGGRDISEAIAPSVGLALNGQASADFDGVDDTLRTALALSNFVSAAAYGGWVLFQADVINTSDPETSAYQNDPLIRSTGSYFGVTLHNAPKVQVWQYDGVDWKASEVAISTGTPQLVRFKYDGANISAKVNGGAYTTRLSGNVASLAGNPTVFGGESFSLEYTDGKIWSIGIINSTPTDADLDKVRNYLRQRLGASV